MNIVQSSINLGLYYKDELISSMIFKKRKILNEYELLRFCSKLNINVIDAATKLFSYFLKNYNPNKVISYDNCDINDSDLYNILGFNEIEHSGINYWWTNGKTRIYFMKEKIKERGYYKIYGTGNMKYEYNLKL